MTKSQNMIESIENCNIEETTPVATTLDTSSHRRQLFMHDVNSGPNVSNNDSLISQREYRLKHPQSVFEKQHLNRNMDREERNYYSHQRKNDPADVGYVRRTNYFSQYEHLPKIEVHNSSQSQFAYYPHLKSVHPIYTHQTKGDMRKSRGYPLASTLNAPRRSVVMTKVQERPINSTKIQSQVMKYTDRPHQRAFGNMSFPHSCASTSSESYLKRLPNSQKSHPQSITGIRHGLIERDYQRIGEKEFGMKAAKTITTCCDVKIKSPGIIAHPISTFLHGNEENARVVQSSKTGDVSSSTFILKAHMKRGSKENTSYFQSSLSTKETAINEESKENKRPKVDQKRNNMGMLDLLCAASEQLRKQLEMAKSCSCPRSRCIKLYCECFQSGRKCTGKCSCKKCKNNVYESGPEGARTRAIQNILSRNPYAFQKNKPISDRNKNVGVVCRCVKSRCLKLYCDCFQRGKFCTNNCMCVTCLNNEKESGPTGRRTSARHLCLQRNPDAFKKKVKKIGQGCSCKNSM